MEAVAHEQIGFAMIELLRVATGGQMRSGASRLQERDCLFSAR